MEDKIGKLIISYDCEGVWGMLDNIDDLEKKIFNRSNLIKIYNDLLLLHEEFDLKATFAFVGALISTKEEFITTFKQFPNAVSANKWCEPILSSNCKFTDEDIYLPILLELVRNTNIEHEISSHGFSHLIMDNNVDYESLQFEILGIKDLIRKKDIDVSTIIFPRNVINHIFLDNAHFISGYGIGPSLPFRSKLLNRAYSLFKEFFPICRSGQSYSKNEKIIIPGSFFINWRNGLRGIVPIWLTVLRLRFALMHASKNNGTVHIWLHPHNLATGKDQMLLLRKIFLLVEGFKKKHKLKILTHAEFLSS